MASEENVLTVSQLTAQIRGELEGRFARVTVEGEIGNWGVAPSGHAYFSLKDDGALLSSAMWRSTRERLAFKPEEGVKVIARGRISVFEKRGQYQLTVDTMKQSGEGDLWARFQKLKEKLEREGLFDPARKRPLPAYPNRVGVVTSPTGAAIRDILNILQRRAPSLSVIIYPTRVQGNGAGAEITRGVEILGKSGLVDVMIVGRGGGSVEDLWEFNDEGLARAIRACPIPVVSAVGHEVDFTIADFVADLRAPTPSAGAEIVSTGFLNLREEFHDRLRRSQRAIDGRLRETRAHIRGLVSSHALQRPELLLREYQQRTDAALRRLPEVTTRRLERLRARIERATGALDGHNPDLILKKGYAIIRRTRDDRVLTSADRLKKNLPISIELRDGKRGAVITDNAAPDLFE